MRFFFEYKCKQWTTAQRQHRWWRKANVLIVNGAAGPSGRRSFERIFFLRCCALSRCQGASGHLSPRYLHKSKVVAADGVPGVIFNTDDTHTQKTRKVAWNEEKKGNECWTQGAPHPMPICIGYYRSVAKNGGSILLLFNWNRDEKGLIYRFYQKKKKREGIRVCVCLRASKKNMK